MLLYGTYKIAFFFVTDNSKNKEDAKSDSSCDEYVNQFTFFSSINCKQFYNFIAFKNIYLILIE